jgi:hypothetical protein
LFQSLLGIKNKKQQGISSSDLNKIGWRPCCFVYLVVT